MNTRYYTIWIFLNEATGEKQEVLSDFLMLAIKEIRRRNKNNKNADQAKYKLSKLITKPIKQTK
jgi:hypothetical protein